MILAKGCYGVVGHIYHCRGQNQKLNCLWVEEHASGLTGGLLGVGVLHVCKNPMVQLERVSVTDLDVRLG